MQERRRHIRADIPLVAEVFVDGVKVDDYLVENLSASGVLLAHGSPLPRNAAVRIRLEGAGIEQLELSGVVVRLDMTPDREPLAGVHFSEIGPETQAPLQRLVQEALKREREPVALVFHRRPGFLSAMSRDFTALGRRVLLAMTELEFVRYAGCPDRELDAVVVDLAWDPLRSLAVLEFAGERFPRARRVAVCRRACRQELAWALARAQAHTVLDDPWTPEELSSIQPHRPDQALCDFWEVGQIKRHVSAGRTAQASSILPSPI